MTQASRSRFLQALGVVLAAGLGAPVAALADPDITKWLAENTDISPAQVVMVSPESVYSLEPLGGATGTGEVIAHVRTEPLTQDWAKTQGFTSWDAHILFDCSLGRLRMIRSATYPQPNLKGAPKAGTQREDWISPDPAQPAAKLLAAACDPEFVWPLRSRVAAAVPAKLAVTPEAVPPRAVPPEIVLSRAAPPPAAPRQAVQPQVGPQHAPVQPVLTQPPPAASAKIAVTSEAVPAQAVPPPIVLSRAAPPQTVQPQAVLPQAVPSQAVPPQPAPAPPVLAQAPPAAAAKIAVTSEAVPAQTVPPPIVLSRAAPPQAVPPQALPAPPVLAQAPRDMSPTASVPASPAVPAKSFSMQIAYGPSQAGAQEALKRARRTLGPAGTELTETTETSQLGSRHRYTAVLGGLPNYAAAADACDRLIQAGQTCFVRDPSAATAPDGSQQGPEIGASAPATDPSRPASPKSGAPYAVQIGRGPSEAGAKVALDRARKALGPLAAELTPEVEMARLGAKRRYTATLRGFANEPAAAEACQKLIEAGQICFTRRTSATRAAGVEASAAPGN